MGQPGTIKKRQKKIFKKLLSHHCFFNTKKSNSHADKVCPAVDWGGGGGGGAKK
jgi:hypothetical protein